MHNIKYKRKINVDYDVLILDQFGMDKSIIKSEKQCLNIKQ